MANDFRWMRKYNKILVTGPQRSGTTIAAKIIASEIDRKFVNEKDFGVSSKALFDRLMASPEPCVIQCPAMFTDCFEYEDKVGVLVVFVMRDLDDIHASEKRIGWSDEARQRELDKLGAGADDDPATVKQDRWKNVRWANAYTIPYESLKSHDLWVEERSHFHAHQTDPNDVHAEAVEEDESESADDEESDKGEPAPLTVVLCKWKDKHHGYKGKFEARHVNSLADMIDKHYPDPHRIVCFTDDDEGIDERIECHPIWDDYAELPNPTGGGRPSCYRRLKLWSKDMLPILGPRFVHMDMDAVVCGDLRPLWNRPEPLVMYKDYHERWPYAGGTYMMNTGEFSQVWEEFDPVESPKLAAAKGYQGSDQAWLNYILPHGLPSWQKSDGIYRQLPNQFAKKPRNARIVFTTGVRPPWGQGITWMKDAYK